MNHNVGKVKGKAGREAVRKGFLAFIVSLSFCSSCKTVLAT